MSRFVVDASVAAKWVLPEAYSDLALILLSDRHDLLAPDLIWPELGNVLARRCLSGMLSVAEAKEVFQSLSRYPLAMRPTQTLVPEALVLATSLGRLIYDCLYLALARRDNAKLVTADRKFFDAVARSVTASSIVWIEDIGASISGSRRHPPGL